MLYNNVIVQTVSSRTGTTRLISMPIADTTFNIATLKNNIFKISNGASVARSTVFAGTQLIHTNNIYQLTNGSVVNYPLTSTEISTQSIIWVNTSLVNPLGWDYHLTPTSPAIGKGVNVNLTRDLDNIIVSNPPEIGIYEYVQTTTNVSKTNSVIENSPCELSYDANKRCVYVNCNKKGLIRITNSMGRLYLTKSYNPGGDWIDVQTLSPGAYFASTYNKNMEFIK
jgi:hypothetical protein